MTTITSEMIKELRDRTGVGIGKCKEALEASHGDMEKAIAQLRKAGMATAVKKEGRTTNEGLIGFAENGKQVAIVEVNAETDFVVKNERFGHFVQEMVEEVLKTHPASLEAFLAQKFSKNPSLTIDQYRATLVQTIGENIQIRRLTVLSKSADKSIGVYSHMGGKIVTVAEVTGSNQADTLAKDIAMHIAAAAPEYLSPEKIPASVLENERDIAKSQVKGKPDNIVDKIVDGKLNAFYDTACLTRQKFIRNDALTIAELVNQKAKDQGKALAVTNFLRWSVGQG